MPPRFARRNPRLKHTAFRAAAQMGWAARFPSMPKKPSPHLIDSAVPKPDKAERLSDGEKEALHKQSLSEHSHGEERERLTEEAEQDAEE